LHYSTREFKNTQLEEKLNRLEQERAELMVTIQKGEGFDTAIQQLQQDNVRSSLFTNRVHV
jgi:hypothetical protein